MTDTLRSYIPAAGHDWALPFYDPLVKLLGGDSARKVMIDQAELETADRVLEVGCGTGTLLMQIKRAFPHVDAVGLDPDPKALAVAARKRDAASLSMQLHRGFSDALPYPDASFDRVFSSFMFHHLKGGEEKRQTLREILRVLRPGGRLQLLDFTPLSGKRGLLAHWLHSSEVLSANAEDRVLSLMSETGFINPRTLARRRLIFGLRTAYYQAAAPMS